MTERYYFQDGFLSRFDTDAPKVFDTKSLKSTSFETKASAVTIGTYDGVHLGHRTIISTLVAEAKARALRSVVVTFEPHPRLVLGKADSVPIQLLSTLDEKLATLESLGVDCVVVINFTKQFSETPAEIFVEEVLVKQIGLAEIIIGYDHMFGKNRGGSFETLARLAEKHQFAVKQIAEQKVDAHHLSSTQIRRYLESGEVEQACKLLGAPYQLLAVVVEGDKRGRTIGFPTANLLPSPEKLIPKRGVYAVDAKVDGKTFRAMMNIGVRPTLKSDSVLSLEAHLFDFDDNIYGKRLVVYFLSRLRDEQKFSSLSDLQAQLSRDKEAAQAVSSELGYSAALNFT